MMSRKLIGVLLCVALVGFGIYGCGTVSDNGDTNPNMSTTPADPPAGTTAVKMSGGSIAASGASLNFDFLALDQDNQALTNMTLGNLEVEIHDTQPTASAVSVSEVVAQGIIQVAFDEITSGANTAKPIAVAMTLDKSGSMWGAKIKTLEAAAEEFVDLMAANSQAAIINFDHKVSVEAAMTTDRAILKKAITEEAAYGGSTAVFDAISAALTEAKAVSSTSYTRAILAMTDGQDNSSISTEVQVSAEAIAAGLPIYTVGLFDSSWEASSYRAPLVRLAEATTGTSESYFEVIAGVTGLSVQSVQALGVLTDIYQDLAEGLTNAYSCRATASSSLTSGQQYWLVLKLKDYGEFDQTLVKPFVAQ